MPWFASPEDIKQLQGKLQTLEEAIRSTQEAHEKDQRKLTAVEKWVDQLEQRLEASGSALGEVQQRVESLYKCTGQIQKRLEEFLAEAETALAKQPADPASLTKVRELLADLGSHMGAQHDDLRSTCDLMQNRLQTMEEELSRVQTDLDEPRALMAALSVTQPLANTEGISCEATLAESDRVPVERGEPHVAELIAEGAAYEEHGGFGADPKGLIGDQTEYAAGVASYNFWNGRCVMLRDALPEALSRAEDLLKEATDAYGGLSESTKIALASQQSGITTIIRLIASTHRKAAAVLEGEEPHLPELPRIRDADGPGRWAEVLSSAKDAATARKLMEDELDRLYRERGNVLRNIREAAERRKKQFLSTVKLVLPVIDGVEDGRKYAEEEYEQCKDATASSEQQGPSEVQQSSDLPGLHRWFACFDGVRNVLLDFLCTVGVEQMTSAARGMPFDDVEHEPLSVTPDSELKDDDIADVKSNGYKLVASDPTVVVRTAQVVAVRN